MPLARVLPRVMGGRCRASAEFGLTRRRVSYALAWAPQLLRADHNQRAAGGVRIEPA